MLYTKNLLLCLFLVYLSFHKITLSCIVQKRSLQDWSWRDYRTSKCCRVMGNNRRTGRGADPSHLKILAFLASMPCAPQYLEMYVEKSIGDYSFFSMPCVPQYLEMYVEECFGDYSFYFNVMCTTVFGNVC